MSAEQDRTPAIGDFRFTTEYRADPDDKNNLIEEDWVSWIKIGDSMGSRTSDKVSRLMENKERNRPAAFEWALIEKHYDAWKKGQAIPVDGTPLASWPGCDPRLAEALKSRNVYTVEQFRDLPDHYTGGIPLPDIRARKKAAADFLDAKKGSDAMREELEKRIAELEEKLTAPKARKTEAA